MRLPSDLNPIESEKNLTLGIGHRRRKRGQLIALMWAGLVLLNYPLLSLFGEPQLFLGIPVLYWYLFGIWFGFILLVGFTLESHLPPEENRSALDDLEEED
jgi:hypothetical protein